MTTVSLRRHRRISLWAFLRGGGATLKWFLGSGQLESATQSPQDSSEEALEYARRLYLNILEWYKIADSKGQLLLTLNGAFVTVMTGFVLGKPAGIATKFGSSV
jgi:hypothetical protein